MADFPNPLGVLAVRPFAPEAWIRAAGDPAPVLLAWELARIPEGLDDPARRRLHLLLSLLLTAQAQGSSRLPLAGPRLEALHRAFGEALVDWPAFLEDPRLAVLVGDPAAGRPLVRLGEHLASRRLVSAEARIVQRLRLRAARPGREVAIPDEVMVAPVPLSSEQRAAVATAAGRPLALITGGPGTGKTSILSALLRTLRASGTEPEAIGLAAPTGKAAQRMGQALLATAGADLPEARTLHRLLGWDPRLGRFQRSARHPLRLEVLLVDEASMIGLELMDALLDALPDEARLVLIGDADQLPSVEAGTVFRDLVAGLPGAVARLTRSHRLDAADPGGRAILEAAQAVSLGRDPELPLGTGDAIEGPGILRWPAVEGELRAFLRRWLARRPGGVPTLSWREGTFDAASLEALSGLSAGWEAARLLCLLREGEDLRCADGLNAFLHREALRGADSKAPVPFLSGEPVLARRNDYQRGLFNGDQGLVAPVSRDGEAPRLEALFRRPEGWISFPLEAVQAGLEHAYALTVHRAQGSEFDHVALVLPPQDHPLLTREILYTALTRARRSVAVLGEAELLALGAARPLQREGGLAL